MTKNILIPFLLVALAYCGLYIGSRPSKPHNQYELLIYQDHFEIKDDARSLGSFKWERSKVIDSVINADNL